jgi:hypothetical protein
MLEDYIFVDEDFNVVLKAGLHDDEVAEQSALRLSKQYMKTIICYRHIVTCDTFDLQAARDALK